VSAFDFFEFRFWFPSFPLAKGVRGIHTIISIYMVSAPGILSSEIKNKKKHKQQRNAPKTIKLPNKNKYSSAA
jgi:hypothetical protein